jgi:hypothetical protein
MGRAVSRAALAAARQAITQAAVRAMVHRIGFSLLAAGGWKYV